MRSLPFISFLAVLLALVMACGGSSPTAIPTPKPAVAALDTLKRSAEAMAAVKSFRARMDLDMRVLGEDLSVSTDLEVGQEGRIHTSMRVDSPTGKQEIEQIVASPHVYTKIQGAGEGWFRMDLEAIAQAAGVSEKILTDPKSFSSSFFPADDIPWELYTVDPAGREEIDGVQTEHMKVQVDFQELWGRLNSREKGRFTQSFGVPGLGGGEIFEKIEMRGMELWIDDRGLQRRSAMDMVIGEFGTVKMEMRMFDFGRDVRIELPKNFTDLPSP